MNPFLSFLPIIMFVVTYVGTGIYYAMQGTSNAFYQLAPSVAILPALIVGWMLHRGNNNDRMNAFLDGVRHRDIIIMCLVFLLAGAFSTVTKSIGSVDATVNLALSLVPSHFLLIGIFITAAFISTAIGTSMGTIATIGPIAANLAQHGAFPTALGMATVVGGAMFGDNLSLISDTTIAAVMSQEADMRKKLKLNVTVATIAALITGYILFSVHNKAFIVSAGSYSLALVSPYLLLVSLAAMGVNVFVVLITALAFAGGIGMTYNAYSLIHFSKDIAAGFSSVSDIMILSLLVGGLSGLVGRQAAHTVQHFSHHFVWDGNRQMAQILIAKIVSIFDILLANNTVAIVFSGDMARSIARQYNIPPHYSAAWLDIFSCVFQGLIPYGAQVLLASSIAGISPLAITPHVYYCYILGGVALLYIVFKQKLEY